MQRHYEGVKHTLYQWVVLEDDYDECHHENADHLKNNVVLLYGIFVLQLLVQDLIFQQEGVLFCWRLGHIGFSNPLPKTRLEKLLYETLANTVAFHRLPYACLFYLFIIIFNLLFKLLFINRIRNLIIFCKIIIQCFGMYLFYAASRVH